MRRFSFIFLIFCVLILSGCIEDNEKFDYFEGNKASPLYLDLTIKNERTQDCKIDVYIQQYLTAIRFASPSIFYKICTFLIKSNESVNLKDLGLANKDLARETIMNYKGSDEDVGFVFPVILEHLDNDEDVIWSGGIPRSDYNVTHNECYYIFQRSKSGTESFGHLVSETDERANGIESGTINAVLTLTEEGAEFSYIFD